MARRQLGKPFAGGAVRQVTVPPHKRGSMLRDTRLHDTAGHDPIDGIWSPGVASASL